MVTGGVSAAVVRGVFAEAHVGTGQDGERTWGVGARLTF
jgi:hypothetical protein